MGIRSKQASDCFVMNTLALCISPELSNSAEEGGNTLVHRAVDRGDLLLLHVLLDQESPLVPNDRQETPLHWACRRGCTLMVKLLSPHCNINALDQEGRTPREWALLYNHTEIAEMLQEGIMEDNVADLTSRDSP